MRRKKWTKRLCSVCKNWKEQYEFETIEGVRICPSCLSDLQRLGRLEDFMKEKGKTLPKRWDEVTCVKCGKWIKKKEADVLAYQNISFCKECSNSLIMMGREGREAWLRNYIKELESTKKGEKHGD